MWYAVLLCLFVSSTHGASVGRRSLINWHIVGGTPADEGEYPGQVSLRLLGMHMCGGSIISEDYVLTSAFCVGNINIRLLTVQAGSNSLQGGGSIHNVLEATAHADYNLENPASPDIALIKVTPPFELSDLVQPVTLAEEDQETPGGSDAVVIGWGTSNNETRSQNLLEADQQIRDHEECAQIYTSIAKISDAQLCADSPNDGDKGVCSGDLGGPLYVEGVMVGVTSWTGKGCATEGFPSVFTRVASYRTWITDHSDV